MFRSIKDMVMFPVAVVKFALGDSLKPELYDKNDVNSRPHEFPEDWSEFFKSSYENNLEAVTMSVNAMESGSEENKKLINQTDSNGLTALHIAVTNNADKVVKFLLEKGIDYNIQNKRGYTAFEIAVGGGHKDFVNLMLDTGKVPKGIMCNVENETAFFLAIANEHLEIASKLVEYYNKNEGAEQTKLIVNHPNIHKVAPILLVTLRNDVQAIKLLLNCGADYTVLNASGKSPVDIAFNNKENVEVYQAFAEFLNQSEAGKAYLEKYN